MCETPALAATAVSLKYNEWDLSSDRWDWIATTKFRASSWAKTKSHSLLFITEVL